MKFNTKLLHGYSGKKDCYGATQVPIYQNSSFSYDMAEDLEKVFEGKSFGYLYSRISNPTVQDIEIRLASLENGIGAIFCSSGMAAVSMALMNILQSGDHLICGSGLFGGTYSLLQDLEAFGITTSYLQKGTEEEFLSLVTDRTRAVFIETIENPKLKVYDIQLMAKWVHKQGIPLIVDNTLISPYLFCPIEEGADIVVHSTTKHLNGSGTAIGGVVIDSGNFTWDEKCYPWVKYFGKFGKFSYLAKLRKGLFKDIGVCNAPMNAYLTSVGIETLGLRMERECENALALARFLDENDAVYDVNYPGLLNNSFYEVAKKQFGGKFGTMLTFRVGSKEKAFRIINRLKLVFNQANLGDVRTLIIHPESTIYQDCTEEEKRRMGVYEDLIRVSVGIEDFEDIVLDFSQALA